MTSVDWMYPSKGRSGNGSLAFAFEIHDIASTREKRQENNVTHAGLETFSTFSRIQAFTNKLWACATCILFVASQKISARISLVGVNTLAKCHVLNYAR
jgi:hypothetical protein